MDGGVDTNFATLTRAKRRDLPEYLVKTYSWAYLKPTSLLIFDNPVVLTGILWGNLPRLIAAACEEFRAGQNILQAASAYGNLSAELAEVVGRDGRLDVIDIAPLQAAHVRRKLSRYPQARVRVADAASPGGGMYDGVCCFFLLHEIPDDLKHRVINSLLGKVEPGGKVVFVDYHQTGLSHPLRPVMHLVFRWLEPFAFGLIRKEIVDFADEPDAFEWTKQIYFGGLYQKVVAVRRSDSLPATTPDQA